MEMIDSITFPNSDVIGRSEYCTYYPFNIFFFNMFQYMDLKDITILYGSNGSGKSTILKLIARKLDILNDSNFYRDVVLVRKDREIESIVPFDIFKDTMIIKYNNDEYSNKSLFPTIIKYITSEDIYKLINNREKHNIRATKDIFDTIDDKKERLKGGYTYKNLDDYDDLVRLNAARKLSINKYVNKYALKKEEMQSNGETALSYLTKEFEDGGLYLLDEPENSLSPVFQIELMKLISDCAKFYDCQFIIATHSPLILSLKDSVIYNLDETPVMPRKWVELENVKLYHNFFKLHESEFKEEK